MTGVKNHALNPRTLNYTKPTHPPTRGVPITGVDSYQKPGCRGVKIYEKKIGRR